MISASAGSEQMQDSIQLHVIYSEKLQAIMHKLSSSVYEEELNLEQINESKQIIRFGK